MASIGSTFSSKTIEVTGTVAATQSGVWSVGRTWTLSNATDSVAAVQSGAWTVSSTQSGVWSVGRTWILASGTDSVAAVQSGTWNINSIIGTVTVTGTVNAAQSGAWTTGRTWVLASGTDSVSAVQSGSWTVAATQSGTWTVNAAQSGSWTVAATQSGAWTVAATQSGTWTTGRTWTLSNSTDSIAAVQSGSWTVAATQSGTWTTGRTWTLSNSTDSIAAVQSGTWSTGRTWTLASGTDSVSAVQSGTWTTGRTWTLSSGTDSVAAVQSGTWNINNISGTISLPTGASTAANQATANTSLASIDSKLTAPLSVTQTQASNPWYATGNVATAATTQVTVMQTAFTYTGTNVSAFIASGSANDTLAGTGAQKITITYFKADGSGPFTETDNMQGTTGFFSSATMAFVQSVVVSQVGSGGTNAGQILVSNLSPLSTMAAIAAGDSETYYCHHFIPLGKTGYLTHFSFGSTATSAGQGGRFFLKKQNIPLSSNATLAVLGNTTLVGSSSTDSVDMLTPIKIAGPCLLQVFLVPDSATANTFSAAMGGYEI